MSGKSLLICCAVLLAPGGCSPRPLPKTAISIGEMTLVEQSSLKKDNAQRVLIGLRLVSDKWLLFNNAANEDNWKQASNGAIVKWISKDGSGNPLVEDDKYYSGKKYETFEGDDLECITTRYDYGSKNIGVYYAGTNSAILSALKPYWLSAPGQLPSTNVALVVALVADLAKQWQFK